jgi:hypothetical protein
MGELFMESLQSFKITGTRDLSTNMITIQYPTEVDGSINIIDLEKDIDHTVFAMNLDRSGTLTIFLPGLEKKTYGLSFITITEGGTPWLSASGKLEIV